MECSLEFRDFFPTAEGVLRNSMAMKEWVALTGYSLFK